MKKILELLGDGRFHSGEEIGAALSVSRSAVWKSLKQLETQTGIRLYKVPGKGYRLAEPISLLDTERLSEFVQRLGWGLCMRETVDSTNAEALRLIQAGLEPPFIVVAEHQANGRGRRGRVWVSPPAENLYYTLALRITSGSQGLTGLSLVVGLAVLAALRNTGLENVGVKWPNDIYADGMKIAGILLELTGDPADICYVVIGVGVNVNMRPETHALDQPWTSIGILKGCLIDRTELANALTESLHHYLGVHARLGFGALSGEWQANHVWQGQRCILSTGTTSIKGIVTGIDEQGALRLLLDDHTEQSFAGGELSLRLDHDS